MKKEEVIENGEFIINEDNPNHSEFRINLYLKFFDQEQEVLFVNLPSLRSEPQMTIVTNIINELLTYHISNKEWLKDEIWKHYETCVKNTSYAIVPIERLQNEVDANRKYFEVDNREEAYNKVHLDQIWIDTSFTNFRYFNLLFSCPWEDEHGISIGIKNGKLDSIF